VIELVRSLPEADQQSIRNALTDPSTPSRAALPLN
jgi:hypothetical protein